MPSPTPPKYQNGILSRPRVDGLLRDAFGRSLVVVTAGTGYGKSQAVRSFIEVEQVDSIWIQLTALDNYQSRFWQIYTHAIKSKSPPLAERMAAMGFPDTLEKTYQFITALAQAIFPHTHCALVLDDFHKMDDPAIIQLIETIAHANLENFTLVLISRYPLPIDYSGLYDNGLLSRISVADLRFTAQETRDYFAAGGLHFSPATLDNIHRSTEGWPLALYLIGLHRQNNGHLFDDPIACTIPLLYSLIEVEIFSHYAEDIRRDLVRLSLLDTVTPDLVRHVCTSGYARMEEVLQRNHFIYYNPQTGRYHFHRLFRRFLQSKKGYFTRAEIRALQRAAGEWCLAGGHLIEAASYFKQCRHYNGLWQLVQLYNTHTHMNSFELDQLCASTLESFPPEYVEANPLIPVYSATLLINLGEFERAHRAFLAIIGELESSTPSEAKRRVLGEAYIGLAHTCIFKKDYAFAAHYKTAAALLPGGSSIITEKHEHVGNHNALYLFENTPGSLSRMVDLMFEIRPLASKVMNGSGHGAEYLCAAEAEYFRGNQGACCEYAYQALYRAQEKNQHDIICSCLFLLMKAALAMGDGAKTLQHLAALQEYTAAHRAGYLHGFNDIGASLFYVKTGQLQKVSPWILAGEMDPTTQSIVNIGKEKIVCALYLLHKNQQAEALALLDKMLHFYGRSGAFFSQIETHLLRCIALVRLGDIPAALAAFSSAYDMAHGNALVMFFIELGQDMRAAMDAIGCLENPAFEPAFLRDIYTRAGTYAKHTAYIAAECRRTGDASRPLAGLLTTHERDILALLCKGATREEIARRTNAGLSSVKTALKSIFAKLGAINRADAVRIAMDAGLFD